ncbi:hypothetical protein B0H14DRAFT_2618500 [Mycena olivaceomarginata]|nr:hypothetical protein B0H14DRAFT_2618500 [Mycena olivaceomarginata]
MHRIPIVPLPPDHNLLPLLQRPRREDAKVRPRLRFRFPFPAIVPRRSFALALPVPARVPPVRIPPITLPKHRPPPGLTRTHIRPYLRIRPTPAPHPPPPPPHPRASSATSSGGPKRWTNGFGAPACAYPFVGARKYAEVGVMTEG